MQFYDIINMKNPESGEFMNFSFDSFVRGNFDYDKATETHTGLWLHDEKMDIGGGKISVEDIDVLKEHPDTDVVTISGLRQDTFEYFINKYGKQLKAIRFFKNKFVEDLSPLSSLPELEYVHFYANQRADTLWDMSKNTSLTGLSVKDFSRLRSIKNIDTAPALKEFHIGNAIWDKMCLDSLMPLSKTNIEKFSFSGKAITDNDFSFIESMPSLKVLDFAANLLTTEQTAWITANFPKLEGFALKAKIDCFSDNSSPYEVPSTIIVGKRKPYLTIKGNEKRIEKYVAAFEALKKKYAGLPYKVAFPD